MRFDARFEHESQLASRVESAGLSTLHHRVLRIIIYVCDGHSDCYIGDRAIGERAGISSRRASAIVEELAEAKVLFAVKDDSVPARRRVVLTNHPETDATMRELFLRGNVRKANPWLLPWVPPASG